MIANSRSSLSRLALIASLLLGSLYGVAFLRSEALPDLDPPASPAVVSMVAGEPVGERNRLSRTLPPSATAAPTAAVDAPGRDELSARIRRLVSDLASELRSSLGTVLTPERYDACVVRSEPCGAELSDAINYASDLAQLHSRIRGDEFRMWLGPRQDGDPRVRQALFDVLDSHTDQLDRIAAHKLLRFGAEFPFSPLPKRAYEAMAQKTVVEADLIAEWHRLHAIPGEVASEFVELSQVSDVRGRRAAWLALGHEETAAAFGQAVNGASSLGSSDWDFVARSAAACGLPCIETMRTLMSRGDRVARIAVYEALTWAPDPYSRRQLAQLAMSAPTDIDQAERDTRDEFVRDVMY